MRKTMWLWTGSKLLWKIKAGLCKVAHNWYMFIEPNKLILSSIQSIQSSLYGGSGRLIRGQFYSLMVKVKHEDRESDP